MILHRLGVRLLPRLHLDHLSLFKLLPKFYIYTQETISSKVSEPGSLHPSAVTDPGEEKIKSCEHTAPGLSVYASCFCC